MNPTPTLLEREKAVLLLLDVQGRLAELMHEKDALFLALERLVRGMKCLGVPIVWLEQNPDGLGRTIPILRNCLQDEEPIPKFSFSACGEPAVVERLAALDRPQVLLAGIETHICIYQTAADLIRHGYEAHVVTDAVSSRSPRNIELGLERIRAAGGHLTGTEMAFCELVRDAKDPAFKELLRLIK